MGLCVRRACSWTGVCLRVGVSGVSVCEYIGKIAATHLPWAGPAEYY